MSDFIDPRAKEAQRMDYSKTVSEKLKNLLASGVPVRQMADLLDANEFIWEEQIANYEPVIHFNARGFIEREQKKDFMTLVPSFIKQIDKTILPPDEGEVVKTGSGNGFEEKDTYPRTRNLVKVLSELGADFSILDGKNSKEMMRGLSYKIFIVPKLEKLVLVNDEEGNATFVIHSVKDPVEESRIYAGMTKEELKMLGGKKVSVINFVGGFKNWTKEIKQHLLLAEGKEEVEQFDESENNNKTEFEEVPEGWFTNSGLKNFLRISSSLIKRLADNYRSTHSEWFLVYPGKNKQPAEYYHPDLVAQLKADVSARGEPAPEGWITNGGFAAEFGITFELIKNLAENYRDVHPEWFHTYLDKKNKPTEHYHPDLVAQLKADVSARGEPAPEGWLSGSALKNILGISFELTKRLAEKYRLIHPEWFRAYLDKSNKPAEHYHADLVGILKKDVEARGEPAPEGWLPNIGLVSTLGISDGSIKQLADNYRATKPEWFQVYLNKINQPTEYYHPELVAVLKKDVEARGEPAPEGWLSRNALKNILGVYENLIDKFVDKYREDHPEWFQVYLNKINRPTEHYHPDLIIRLKQDLMARGEPAAEGWVTNNNLATELGVAFLTVKKLADKYREIRKDWFRFYLGKKNQQSEYFHPDLILQIKKDLVKTSVDQK